MASGQDENNGRVENDGLTRRNSLVFVVEYNRVLPVERATESSRSIESLLNKIAQAKATPETVEGNPVRPAHESPEVIEDDIATTLNFTVEKEETGDYHPFRGGANRIFLRRCYLDLLELIPQNLSRNGMRITGTAGVGRSVFAWILITELAKQDFVFLPLSNNGERRSM